MTLTSPKVVVVHLGARMHYAVPMLLHREGFLAHMFTDAYVNEGSWSHQVLQYFPSFLQHSSAKRLTQRSSEIPADKITAFNWWGLVYQGLLHLGSSKLIHEWVKHFGERVAVSPCLRKATMLYGFKHSSLELLHAARRQAIPAIVEQMSAPLPEFYRIIDAEAKQWPDWIVNNIYDRWNDRVWFDREAEEQKLADILVAPSLYVRTALLNAGVSSDKIITLPYAVSQTVYQGGQRYYDGVRPLRVLFVGTLNLAKGVPYLLEALRRLGPEHVEARLVGGIAIKPEKLAEYGEVAQVTGRVPRAEVVTHYKWADVFVLPSLCEGSATVTYEAQACGLPVIVTPNTGAWVVDGEDGLVVPIRDVQGLTDSLKEFIQKPFMVQRMSQMAIKNASEFSWEAYQRRLSTLVESLHRGKLPGELGSAFRECEALV